MIPFLKRYMWSFLYNFIKFLHESFYIFPFLDDFFNTFDLFTMNSSKSACRYIWCQYQFFYQFIYMSYIFLQRFHHDGATQSKRSLGSSSFVFFLGSLLSSTICAPSLSFLLLPLLCWEFLGQFLLKCPHFLHSKRENIISWTCLSYFDEAQTSQTFPSYNFSL